jgi:hypothetical protein
MNGRTARLSSPAMQWNVNAEHIDYAGTIFRAILSSNGFSVLAERELAETREQMRPESVPGHSILWSEKQFSRSLVARWPDGDAMVLISQSTEFSNVGVAKQRSSGCAQNHRRDRQAVATGSACR